MPLRFLIRERVSCTGPCQAYVLPIIHVSNFREVYSYAISIFHENKKVKKQRLCCHHPHLEPVIKFNLSIFQGLVQPIHRIGDRSILSHKLEKS